MERIKLGRTDLMVSPICFGCWQMGGTMWGPADEDVLSEAVHKAVDIGVNFFDVADAYGDGAAEEILGSALRSIDRSTVVIATKVYHHCLGGRGSRRVGDLSYEYILQECDQSLKRLGVDCIDLYQAHQFDPFTHLEETAKGFEELKRKGKIRYYGTSNFSADQLRAALKFGDFDTVQPKYNLHAAEIEDDVLPLCMANDLGVLAYSPMHHGLLTGKYDGSETFDDFRSETPEFAGQEFRRIAERVRRLQPIADEMSKTIPQLALRFVLDHPAVHCAIAGTKTPAQITETAGATGWKLSRDQYYLVRQTFGGGV